jgi:hypothetical protein
VGEQFKSNFNLLPINLSPIRIIPFIEEILNAVIASVNGCIYNDVVFNKLIALSGRKSEKKVES